MRFYDRFGENSCWLWGWTGMEGFILILVVVSLVRLLLARCSGEVVDLFVSGL